jgi:hypothetical protein
MGSVSQSQGVCLPEATGHEQRGGLVERGRLHESLEVFKIRTICFDGFFFAAGQECVEEPSGGGRRGQCRRNGDGRVKLFARFPDAIAGRSDHVG